MQKAAEWLAEKWRHGPCPVCHENNWSYYPRLGQVSNLDYAGRMVPMLLVGCNVCGYTVFINAIEAGIVKEPGEDAVDLPEGKLP